MCLHRIDKMEEVVLVPLYFWIAVVVVIGKFTSLFTITGSK